MRKAPRKLRVPLYLQGDKPHCGRACARMVMAYHGLELPLSAIVRSTKAVGCGGGVDLLTLSSYLLGRGFDVTLIGWVREFPGRAAGEPPEIATAHILRWSARRTGPFSAERRFWRRGLAKFIDAGGTFIPRPVSLRDLRAAVRRGHPPILNLNTATLYRRPGWWQTGHYVVPVRVVGGRVTILDPNFGPAEYPIEWLLYACYVWDAAAIFVRPRKEKPRCRENAIASCATAR